MHGEIFVVGMSHHTAPVELRERLAVGNESLTVELDALREGAHFAETVLLSTCNRVEVYATANKPAEAVERALGYFRQRAAPEPVEGLLYALYGTEAVHHIFRVAASLDSMVVGEPQILGQLKHAYAAAHAAAGIGTLLGRCFMQAFAVAKRVRTETAIAAGAVSVSSIATELALKIFGRLRNRRTLLVGAGKMGEAAAGKLARNGARLIVMNRSTERAQELARKTGGEAREYEQLVSELVHADVVITSTSSPRFVLTREIIHDVIRARRRRPLFIIDIAVPRNVDPRVGEMDNVFLYDVDDLQQVATENLKTRRRAAAEAERIVQAEVQTFERWRRSLSLAPTISALRDRFREVARSELERTLPRMRAVSEEDRRTLEAMCDAMVNKLLHQPLAQLRQSAEDVDETALIDAARRLFELPNAEGSKPDDPTAGKAVLKLQPVPKRNTGERS